VRDDDVNVTSTCCLSALEQLRTEAKRWFRLPD